MKNEVGAIVLTMEEARLCADSVSLELRTIRDDLAESKYSDDLAAADLRYCERLEAMLERFRAAGALD